MIISLFWNRLAWIPTIALLIFFLGESVQQNRYLSETYALSIAATSSSVEQVWGGNSTRTRYEEALNSQSERSGVYDAVSDLPNLRLDWGNLQVSTPLGKRIAAFQSNCSIPMGKLIYRNKFGLGSDLHIWGTVICNAMEIGRRVVTHKPWIYEDQQACRDFDQNPSGMACYFSTAEMQCPQDMVMATHAKTNATRLYLRKGEVGLGCDSIQKDYSPADIRAAATEFLFAGISPIVVHEARKQLLKVFGPQGPPANLITVHIRWGDKRREMKLVSATQYVDAVRKLLQEDATGNVFLATEDPEAVREFRVAAPSEWNIYVDAYLEEFLPHRDGNAYNGNPRMSTKLGGSPGLVGLASLLVAMEANDFVLTTASNWSRVINELRKTVLRSRLDRLPRVIDLRRRVDGKW